MKRVKWMSDIRFKIYELMKHAILANHHRARAEACQMDD